MKSLVFATSNPNKVREVNQLIGSHFILKSLEDIGCMEDIPETQNTVKGNAIQKAKYVYENYGENCFAEDTSLQVNVLGGEPGVFSARYAGIERDPQANMDLLLSNLKHHTNRNARFKTVVALIEEGEIICFEGIATGKIAMEKSGEGGFGYDPIFIPDGYSVSFAEMSNDKKNKISHRAKAINKFINYIKTKHTI